MKTERIPMKVLSMLISSLNNIWRRKVRRIKLWQEHKNSQLKDYRLKIGQGNKAEAKEAGGCLQRKFLLPEGKLEREEEDIEVLKLQSKLLRLICGWDDYL